MSLPTELPTELHADCSACAGLCCVALAFARSADFGYDKPAGEPCTHLADDDRCRIHDHLRDKGFRGCTVFDCFGAGQKVTQLTFGGTSWRQDPAVRGPMLAALPVMRRLHELLWLVDAAVRAPGTSAAHPDLERARSQVDGVTRSSAADLLEVDADALREEVNPVLRRAADLARAGGPRGRHAGDRRLRPGADLLGAALGGRDLRGASLRGALLIAADLAGSDLGRVDLTGADLRDARLHGSDLREALFLTQVQLDAATGDPSTRLPASLRRPRHWHG